VADDPTPYGGFFPPVPVTQEAWPGARPAVWAPPPPVTAWPTQLLQSQPRSGTSRIWLTVAIIFAPFVAAVLLGGIVGVAMASRTYPTDAAYEAAISHASAALGWGVTLCMLVAYAVAARKVSYRWFDVLFTFVPIYSIFWMIKIAYRVAYLPHKDWAPRPEEVRPSLAPTPGWPTY
jgi:hypothetical protein